MFWVHGGALHGGYGFEASFDGEAFCRKGVILVTINYRLGLLGFYASSQLSQESPDHVSGNYGYLDQIAALKWVKENIYNFGGDPENITVFGQSAGAGSVMNLVTSPLSRHLMRKAILQSGVFLFKFGSPGGIGMGFSNTPDIRSMEALGMNLWHRLAAALWKKYESCLRKHYLQRRERALAENLISARA